MGVNGDRRPRRANGRAGWFASPTYRNLTFFMPPTPMHNINHRSDARPAAVATVRERISHPDRVVFAFGTTHAMTVASGATRSLSLHAGDFSTSDALWAAVRSFVFEGEVRGRPVVGYLGYGLNDPAGVLMASDSPDLYLFIPEEIETVSHPVRPTASYRPVAAAESPAFVEQVRNVSRWIDGAPARRATIAREVTLPDDTDLPGVLAAPVRCNRAGLWEPAAELVASAIARVIAILLFPGSIHLVTLPSVSPSHPRLSPGRLSSELVAHGWRRRTCTEVHGVAAAPCCVIRLLPACLQFYLTCLGRNESRAPAE